MVAVVAVMPPATTTLPIWVLPMLTLAAAMTTGALTVSVPALAFWPMEANVSPKMLVVVPPALSRVIDPPLALNTPECDPPLLSLIVPIVTGASTLSVNVAGLLPLVSWRMSPAVVVPIAPPAEYWAGSTTLPAAPAAMVWVALAADATVARPATVTAAARAIRRPADRTTLGRGNCGQRWGPLSHVWE